MTENLNLFANSSSVPIVISASQGESNARSFKIQIVGTDNLPIDLEGSTTSLYILVDPETEIQIPGIVEGTYVTFTLTYNSTLTAGKHECWIQIIKPNDSDLRIDNLTLYVQKCNIDDLAEQSPEFGTLTQLITEAQEAIANANEAAEEASSTASTTATNIVNQQKAQPNGLATLDSSGKLVQMPTATDVGAVPISEKGATNGIATLDGSGKLVQMPTAADVGITEMHQTITANERFKSVAVRVARIGNIVTITAPIISNYKKGEGGYPAMLTLPADYRPSTVVDILLPTTGSGDMANIMINNTSGNVTVGLLGSSDTVNLRINFSYVI